MVGIVVTISPNFSLYRMVVLPAASKPTINILISFVPMIFWSALAKKPPMMFWKECKRTCWLWSENTDEETASKKTNTTVNLVVQKERKPKRNLTPETSIGHVHCSFSRCRFRFENTHKLEQCRRWRRGLCATRYWATPANNNTLFYYCYILKSSCTSTSCNTVFQNGQHCCIPSQTHSVHLRNRIGVVLVS